MGGERLKGCPSTVHCLITTSIIRFSCESAHDLLHDMIALLCSATDSDQLARRSSTFISLGLHSQQWSCSEGSVGSTDSALSYTDAPHRLFGVRLCARTGAASPTNSAEFAQAAYSLLPLRMD